MKVLHVYRTYFPDTQGGAEEVVRQICRTTNSQGVESRVFYPSDNPHPAVLESGEGQLVRVKKNFEIASCGFCLGGFTEFQRQVRWADIVHYHFPWPFADLMHLTNKLHRPSLVTYHSDIVRQQLLGMIYGPMMHRFLDSMDRIVPTSPNYADSSDILEHYNDKLSIIPIGIDEDSYPKPDDETLTQAEQTFGRDFFLFVGVWRYYKGLQFMLEAMQDKPFRAVIVGTGPEEKRLKALASRLGLRNVMFPGYVDDVTKVSLLKLCRAFILPSHLRSEAFGVTLLESAMMGKPMISAEIGTGTSFINLDQQTGLVVPPADVNALQSAMDFLHGNPAEARSMGLNARQRFESHFTGAQMGRNYHGIYQSLVGEK